MEPTIKQNLKFHIQGIKNLKKILINSITQVNLSKLKSQEPCVKILNLK